MPTGRPPLAEPHTSVNVYLADELLQALSEIAATRRVSRSKLIREAIREWLKGRAPSECHQS